MSGIAAIIGENNLASCHKMLAELSHRGPDISGTAQISQVVLGQNYLPADTNGFQDSQIVLYCPTRKTTSYPKKVICCPSSTGWEVWGMFHNI